MIKSIIVLGFSLLLVSHKVPNCDCAYGGSFLQMTPYTSLVAYVKVVKYLTYREIYDEKIPMSMQVEIIEVYRGVESSKTVVVWGDIGILCRPYLSSFKEGQYYVIAFNSGNYGGGHPDEKDSDYSISSCGTYWLKADAEKSTVTGDVENNNRKYVTITLQELKKKISLTKPGI